jgi:hypothetical protein
MGFIWGMSTQSSAKSRVRYKRGNLPNLLLKAVKSASKAALQSDLSRRAIEKRAQLSLTFLREM